MIEKTKKTTPSRYANQRMHWDESVVFPILDEALFCTVSYSVDDKPYAIPTAFVRNGHNLYIHGSVGSHFLREIEKGIPVCISIMLVDDLVVAKSAFNHSVNYRSVILFSNAVKLDDYDVKYGFFKELTEKIVPNSWDYLRPIKAKEIDKTTLLVFEIKEAAAKVRSGEPIDEEEDMRLPIWSGLIPINNKKCAAVPDSSSTNIALPNHLMY